MREALMAQPFNDTLSVPRAPIHPANFSRPFWEATREKKLLVQYCPKSGKYQFFPRPVSLFTGRRHLEWREVSGRGTIYTYTIANLGLGPFRGHEPYVVAIVDLEEGCRIMANVVHCTAEQLAIGLAVVPFWAPLPDGTHLLMFQPAA
jgi:uncharacterized OB-fold protein